MKKSILAVLLMFALVVPSFAETVVVTEGTAEPVVVSEGTVEPEGTVELVAKVGYGLSPQLKSDGDTVDVNSPYMVSAEGYVYITPSIGLGLGANHIFDAALKDAEDFKVGATNIYASIKPKLGFIANLYLLGQVGYGLMRVPDAPKIENGIYWGVGAGVELAPFIVEVIYSNNNFKLVNTLDQSIDITYSMIAVNVGLKFSI